MEQQNHHLGQQRRISVVIIVVCSDALSSYSHH